MPEAGDRKRRVAVGKEHPGGVEHGAQPGFEIGDISRGSVDILAQLGAGRFFGGQDRVLGNQFLTTTRPDDAHIDPVENLAGRGDRGVHRGCGHGPGSGDAGFDGECLTTLENGGECRLCRLRVGAPA